MAKIARHRKFSAVGGFRVGAEKVPFSAPPGMTGCFLSCTQHRHNDSERAFLEQYLEEP